MTNFIRNKCNHKWDYTEDFEPYVGVTDEYYQCAKCGQRAEQMPDPKMYPKKTVEIKFQIRMLRTFRYTQGISNPMSINEVIEALRDGLSKPASRDDKLPWECSEVGNPVPLDAALFIEPVSICEFCDMPIECIDGSPCCRRYLQEQVKKQEQE